MENNLITVVTINLNNKEGLLKTIQSILHQTYRDSIEFIVVDGDSQDGSAEIINENKNSIDKYLIEKDKGIFDAMNKSIDLASGEYIYFLNSGDVFASNDVIETVIKTINKTGSKESIIYGKVATFRFGNSLGIAELFPWLAHQGAFVKTTLMKEYRFDTNVKVLGDLDLWKRLHNDGKYKYLDVDKVIANLELDGIGSHPKSIGVRMKDKRYLAKKHNDYSNLIASHLIWYTGKIVYLIFGELFFYKQYCTGLQRLRVWAKRISAVFKKGTIQSKKVIYGLALYLNAFFPWFYSWKHIMGMAYFKGIYFYVRDYISYKKQGNQVFKITFSDSFPFFYDRFEKSGSVPRHYFLQDIWAARKILHSKADLHYDIGSRLDGFISHVLVFTKVTMIDIRPLDKNIKNLNFIQSNAMDMSNINSGSIKSLSSLHAVEHFGLGRYGDPIDPNGYLRAINEMKRILAFGGELLFSVPVGSQRLMFNAHRVFNPPYIVDLFTQGNDRLRLIEFSIIDDNDNLIVDTDPALYPELTYGCGLYHFRKD